MTDFIRIQSTMNITVTAGLQHQDVSSPDAHVADRLKVVPEWFKGTCLIHEGVGNYPAFIKDWPTVQALVRDGILTISGDAIKVTDDEKAKAANLEADMSEMTENKGRNRRNKNEDGNKNEDAKEVEEAEDAPEVEDAPEEKRKSLEEIMAEKMAAKEGE